MSGVAVTSRRVRIASAGSNGSLSSKDVWIWVFLLPTLILFGAYTIYPIVVSYWYSLVEWNGFQAHARYVGLANYAALLADPLFWNSFWITLAFMAAVVPIRVVGALLLAITLNSPKLPFSTLLRTAFFLPVVTTTAIVGVVMQFIFDPVSGPVNILLRDIGLSRGGINFLGDPSLSLWTTVLVYVWKGFGITLIYWLAALQTIPRDVFEAARIDGAGPWVTLRSITLPLLVPFLIIITLLTVENTLQVFDLVLTMTNGGPYYATEVIEVYIYRWAFAASIPQLGYASAAAVLFGGVRVRHRPSAGRRVPLCPARARPVMSPVRARLRRSFQRLPWWCATFGLLVAAALWIYPFVWTVSASLKSSFEVFGAGLNLIPASFEWSNYERTWVDAGFGQYLLNTVIVSVCTVAIVVVRCALAGYVLGRYRFRGSRAISAVLVATLFVPTGYTIIPAVELSLRLGLLNSLSGLIVALSGTANVAAILLYAGYFRQLPAELEEAANH